jgi:hypothetical protein
MRSRILLVAGLLFHVISIAQTKIVRDGEFYFAWGYNDESYTRSDIHVSQPGQNSDFTFYDLQAHDHRGWDNLLLRQAITIPQFNGRAGYFFDKDQHWAIELNYDHAKYIVTYNQSARLHGTVHGRSVDTTITANEGSLLWMLNNGANFWAFNLVRKITLWNGLSNNLRFDCLLKAGAGPVTPHVQNTILGHDNVPHFQFGGFDASADISLRATIFKHVFLEYTNKAVYANYWGLRVYDGTASQHFGSYEMVLVLGASFKL